MSEMRRTALISQDALYRYRLSRSWADPGTEPMVWLMLNPSTADDKIDDQTIRRCITFTEREGYTAFHVLNLYALRCTQPKHLADHPDPEGPLNVETWDEVLMQPHGPVVAAWGSHNLAHLPRPEAFRKWVPRLDLMCLGTTSTGEPRHPSRLAADTPLSHV